MDAAADAQNYAQKLGITTDMVVQELGWDEDTDDGIRAAVEETIGGEMLDEDSDEVIDVVLPRLEAQSDATLVVARADGSRSETTVLLRIDTPIEVDYYRHGGILPFVLRQLLAA